MPEDRMPEDRKGYLDRLAWRTSLDCGGYEWTDGAEKGLDGAAVTDGDISYFLGAPSDCGIDENDGGFLAFDENDGHFERRHYPETLMLDGDMYRRTAEGSAYACDTECSWCTYDSENECERPPQESCERCDGSGYIDCPGGEWAWYSPAQDADERADQQWSRAILALAVYKLGSEYHSGQSSKGYAKLCQAQRILDAVEFRPGAMGLPLEDEDVRGTAAAYLWRHRRDVARNW